MLLPEIADGQDAGLNSQMIAVAYLQSGIRITGLFVQSFWRMIDRLSVTCNKINLFRVYSPIIKRL